MVANILLTKSTANMAYRQGHRLRWLDNLAAGVDSLLFQDLFTFCARLEFKFGLHQALRIWPGLDFLKMCSIGEHLGEDCQIDPLYVRSDFSKDEWKLLRLRSGRSFLNGVCHAHKLNYLDLYERRQKVCCNPFPNRHPKKPVAGSSTITLELYRKAKNTFVLVPGKKLCYHCMKAVNELVGDSEEIESSQSTNPTPDNSQPNKEADNADQGGLKFVCY